MIEDETMTQRFLQQYTGARCVRYSRFARKSTHAAFVEEIDASSRSPTTDVSGPCMGGVLADVMGLGKTLTTLSLIVQMQGDAAKHRSYQQELASDSSTLLSKSTLVVVPSLR